MGDDLNDWYRRRGFMFSFDVDKDMEYLFDRHGAEMLRLPQTPDDNQPVGRLFS
jgi:hypothetical protein